MPIDTPSHRALEFAIIGSKNLIPRRGRHQTNLFEVLKREANDKLNIKLDSKKSLDNIREVAKDEKMWNDPTKIQVSTTKLATNIILRSHFKSVYKNLKNQKCSTCDQR